MACVRPDSLLTLHYRLAAQDGRDWVNTHGHRPATLTLGAGQLAPELEACLLGLEEGASARFELPPGAAFGATDPARVQRVARAALEALVPHDVSLQPGDTVQFAALSARGGAPAAAMVSQAADAWVELDFNHPLAGKAVVFEVQILSVL
ncbi:FKBP-type 16 kDa peptidyl-prolyl cis-trans isomerase [mine drainage metagenome]|uniref:peptidylprolyl isomerase n=1 Tax=mine drainage metagenome TaxID=410659 RepID=A0A1J5Q4F2_9ZZZZ